MIRAIRYGDADEFRRVATPGSIWFDVTRDPALMWFRCPCGCGDLSAIPVGRYAKPAGSPSWCWSGPLDSPTLTPSLRQTVCGWHGYLRDGYWEAC